MSSKKAKPEQTEKDKKAKLVRDSFTIPKSEYAALEQLKVRALGCGVAIKKSELLRAGLMALTALPDAGFKNALAAVPTLKTGRPTQQNPVSKPAAKPPRPGGGTQDPSSTGPQNSRSGETAGHTCQKGCRQGASNGGGTRGCKARTTPSQHHRLKRHFQLTAIPGSGRSAEWSGSDRFFRAGAATRPSLCGWSIRVRSS